MHLGIYLTRTAFHYQVSDSEREKLLRCFSTEEMQLIVHRSWSPRRGLMSAKYGVAWDPRGCRAIGSWTHLATGLRLPRHAVPEPLIVREAVLLMPHVLKVFDDVEATGKSLREAWYELCATVGLDLRILGSGFNLLGPNSRPARSLSQAEGSALVDVEMGLKSNWVAQQYMDSLGGEKPYWHANTCLKQVQEEIDQAKSMYLAARINRAKEVQHVGYVDGEATGVCEQVR